MRSAQGFVLMVALVAPAAGQGPQMLMAPLDVAQLGGSQAARSGVFRCEVGGRTVYQAEPCDDPATQSELGRGSFTVVDPHPVPARPAGGKSKSVESARRVGGGSEDAEAAALKKKADCDYHQRAIARIDAQARVRSTARLAERRRGHKDSMWRLGCGFP